MFVRVMITWCGRIPKVRVSDELGVDLGLGCIAVDVCGGGSLCGRNHVAARRTTAREALKVWRWGRLGSAKKGIIECFNV